MKIKIHLFGSLGVRLPEYASPKGIDMELPDKSTAGDLLKYLKIPDSWGPVVSMDSRLLKNEDNIRDGADIKIFQSVHGG